MGGAVESRGPSNLDHLPDLGNQSEATMKVPSAIVAMVLLLIASDVVDAQTPAADTSVQLNTRQKYVLGAHFSSNQVTCSGAVQLSGYVIDAEAQWTRTGNNGAQTATTGGAFNAGTGLFTPPYNGFYQICMAGRVRENAHGDLTIRVDGSQVCATGTILPSRVSNSGSGWSSHQICCNQKLTTSSAVTFWLESTGSNDCVMETTWWYTRVDIHMLLNT